MHSGFLLVFLFLLGLCVGSFFNAMIWRVYNKMGFFLERSLCPKCKHTLAWYDLIPVFSYVFLKGRCRYCSQKIPFYYPFWECVFGLMFAFIGWHDFPVSFGWNADTGNFIFLLFLSTIFLGISMYDILYLEILDGLIIPLIWGVLAITLGGYGLVSIESALMGVFIPYSFFYIQILIPGVMFSLKQKRYGLIWEFIMYYFLFFVWLFLRLFFSEKKVDKIFRVKEDEQGDEDIPSWIGWGDLRMAVLMGLLLGVEGVLVALFVSYFIGGVFGIVRSIVSFFNKKTYSREIPFLPFLSLGTLTALIIGKDLLFYYNMYFFLF